MACQVRSNVRTKCHGWGAVWPGKDQVRTPIGVAGTSRSSLIIMYMVQVACNCISLFFILAQCTITVTAQFSLQFQANSTAKESSEFLTGDFFGDFWPDFGGLTSCPDKLCGSPKACRKIRTNLGNLVTSVQTKVSSHWTDLHRGNPGSSSKGDLGSIYNTWGGRGQPRLTKLFGGKI